MNTYQKFLDFFSMHNKERLDGLTSAYFDGMAQDERKRAYDFLFARVVSGGVEEDVNGIFMADSGKAMKDMAVLLNAKQLGNIAEIVVAGHMAAAGVNMDLLPIFINAMSSPERELRELGARYVPATVEPNVLNGLQGMVRTETDRRLLIQAATKLLQCFDLSVHTIDKDEYIDLFNDLLSNEIEKKERALAKAKALAQR
ncbi:hypothetical protein E7V67_005800 [[Empedobacter] haloabium]|uniref:Uncharacterized protein n=1 Tax=[Empedobacter] haloabium TaxID=592317 RepID=A0ABZ1UPM7_9BURK